MCSMKQQQIRPTIESLEALSHDELVVLVLRLFDQVDRLTEKMGYLESKLNQNSKNSSKPPSSDGLKRQPAQPRQKGQHPSGGQKGHKGHSLEMHPSPDFIKQYVAEGYCECGLALSEASIKIGERRQQWDIPEPRIEVTEHQQVISTCRCGKVHKGDFPSSLPPYISYGSRLKAYTVGLVQGHFVSLSRSTEILQDQYGIKPSDGSVQNWIAQASDRLSVEYQSIQQNIIKSQVAHFDESGIRTQGKTQWLHVAATSTEVYYTANAKRGEEGMIAAGILPLFKGVAVHDHWKPYFCFTEMDHSLCCAHLLRELNAFEERLDKEQSWPSELKQTLIDAKTAVFEAKSEQRTQLLPDKRVELEQRYDNCINNGLKHFPEYARKEGQKGKVAQHPARNLLCRMRDFKDLVLRFIQRFDVPFDNNLAERAVRPVKVKLKVAGGFRAVGGADAFCIIRSVWETNKLQAKNPFESLRLAFT